ncbi:MAG: ABC transporter substrate-binding protein [Acetobacteraceae bacterium]|nr:ABC transporter substrate-binding protein [Acetobacteraceae bacterium]
MRTLLLALLLAATEAAAQPIPPVKIGVITDMNGSLSAQTGQGAVLAVEMAAEDCLAAECKGMTVEVISADHQNKADVAVGIVRDWWDNKGVTAVADIVQATVQIAVQHEAAARHKVALFSGGTARLTSEDCAPATSVMWMWDTYGQAAGIVRPLAKPGQKWFFITADYVFGKSLQADATALLEKAGATVIGSVSHPFNFSGDFSPFLLQAQASGADVIALGNTGTDLITSVKQAREFGIGTGKQQLVSFVLTVPDIAALGLETAQGILVNEASYWDLDDRTREWSRRFAARNGGRMPSNIQAGDYSVARAYLRAVAAAHSTATDAVIAKLHELPVDDLLTRNGTLRPDGRMVHDTYLFRVKSPAQSKEPYDVYDRVATIPAAEAFRPLAEGKCAALKQ